MIYIPQHKLLDENVDVRNDYNKFVRRLQRAKHADYDLRVTLPPLYLSGAGIEIGAFHAPLPVPDSCNIEYLDKVTNNVLRKWMPEYSLSHLVHPILIDDGENVELVNNQTLDFIVANHMLEHCQNLFRTIENHMNKVRKDGILFYAVPDKTKTFDSERELTSYQHLKNEYVNGHEKNARDHFVEYAKIVNKLHDHEQIEEYVNSSISENRDIHFHVWTQNTFIEHVNYWIKEFEMPLSIIYCEPNGIEFIMILKRL